MSRYKTRSASEIPPVTRDQGTRHTHWDDHLQKAIDKEGTNAPVHVVVCDNSGSAANAVARLRKRAELVDKVEFEITQRKEEVYIKAV